MYYKLLFGSLFVVASATIISIPVVRSAQLGFETEAVQEHYRICENSYKLIEKKEEALKLLGTKDAPKWLGEHLKFLREVESSCETYQRYLKKWGKAKIKPSEELEAALVSRYEPEKLKQK